MNQQTEIWKDVAGYEGLYQISTLGRIKSLKRKKGKADKIRVHNITRTGYHIIDLYKNNKCKYFSVHRLVALAFIPNPLNKSEVNHIDGNKSNNNLTNLEWNTRAENTDHASTIGLRKELKGEKNHKAKLTEEKVRNMRSHKGKISTVKLAEMFGVTQASVSGILLNKTWKHIL